MSCLSSDILPPFFALKRFVMSPRVSNTLFILDSYSKFDNYAITRDPEVESTFLRIFNVFDRKNVVVGHIIKYRKMTEFEFGNFYVKLGRYSVDKPNPSNTWACEKMTFYEGETGCLLFNTCPSDTFASSMMEAI